MSRPWQTRSLTLSAVFAGLFLLALAVQTWSGWIVFKAHQQTHGEPGNVLGYSGYVWPWLATVAQVVAFAALAGFLALQVGRARAGGDRELHQTLRRLEARLAELSRSRALQEADGSGGSGGSERRRPAVEGEHLPGEVVRSRGGQEDGHAP